MPPTDDLPLFSLSPRYGREIAGAVAAAGLTTILLRRVEDVSAAFAATPSRIALVDARGALVAGLSAARELGAGVEARRGALLVLLSRGDEAGEAAVFAAGATQVLTSPFSMAQLADALRFAKRSVERLDDAASGRIVDDVAHRRDVLTGLATAAHARGWIELLLGAPLVSDPAAIVLVLTIGRFGQLNATYGRTIADELLQAVAARLRAVVADAAQPNFADPRMIARLAGAEFAVILSSPVTLTDAMLLSQRMTEAFAPAFSVGAHVIHLGCRIGIAAADAEMRARPDGAETLFRHASAALVMARAREPGSVEVFQAALGDDPMMRMAGLESDLRRAVDDDELEILFQPQVDIAHGHIVGVEALVRWQHPELGELSAQTLLEVAESAEFSTQIGDRIRAKALIEAASWGAALHRTILSLNVTAADLGMPDFGSNLLAALRTTGFPPARLMVEVTESDLIENLERASRVLGKLRDVGIKVALDDFGTGYSSLAYLRELPLDYLKIDKRLIVDLAGSARDQVVVKSVVDMAKALGMRTIAEGVETATQLALVSEVGCDTYQGYRCSPPIQGSKLAAFVEHWNSQTVERRVSR